MTKPKQYIDQKQFQQSKHGYPKMVKPKQKVGDKPTLPM